MFRTKEEVRRKDKAPWLGRIYEKGQKARREGKGRQANPYYDDVNPRGGVNFNRARWRAWNEGWEEAYKK